jgi:hypothetical protein
MQKLMPTPTQTATPHTTGPLAVSDQRPRLDIDKKIIGEMKQCFLICILSVWINLPSLNSQQLGYINGRVIDSKSSEPISHATILLKNSRVGVFTNAEGDFKVLMNPQFQNDSLIITSIGFDRFSIAFKSLKVNDLNTIKLQSATYLINEVTVKARRKHLNSETIINRALQAIKKNYPEKPFSYVSYYRDYQKDSTGYLNLNEAIIQSLDSGFSCASDNNRYRLLDFRKNTDFKRVNISPYYYIPESDHSEDSYKKMPMALVGDQFGNELFILLAHDAIRNYDKKEFSFIDTLTRSFIKNHRFSIPEGIFNGNIRLLKINFVAKPNLIGDIYFVNGAIYIEPGNYSIHKLEYAASYLDREKKQHEIYRIEIEYGHEATIESKMYLRYISFNNTFKIPDSTDNNYFRILRSQWRTANPYSEFPPDLTIESIFNKDIDPVSGMKQAEIEISIGKRKAHINNIRVDGSILYLTLRDDNFSGETNPDSCKINFQNLKDINGNLLNKRRDITIHQYRELFVQEYNKLLRFQNDCTIQYLPLEKNCISNSADASRFWMNTPLKINF